MNTLNDGTPSRAIASISRSTASVKSLTIMWKPKSTAALPSAFRIQVSSAWCDVSPRNCVA